MEVIEFANWQSKIFMLFRGIFGIFHAILKRLLTPCIQQFLAERWLGITYLATNVANC